VCTDKAVAVFRIWVVIDKGQHSTQDRIYSTTWNICPSKVWKLFQITDSNYIISDRIRRLNSFIIQYLTKPEITTIYQKLTPFIISDSFWSAMYTFQLSFLKKTRRQNQLNVKVLSCQTIVHSKKASKDTIIAIRRRCCEVNYFLLPIDHALSGPQLLFSIKIEKLFCSLLSVLSYIGKFGKIYWSIKSNFM